MSGSDVQGLGTVGDTTSLLNAIHFVTNANAAQRKHVSLVKVIGMQKGGASQPATVTIQPMVHQTDGSGNLTPHGNIFNIPVFRPQAGSTAFFVDPKPGDIGVAVFCDADSSTVVNTKAPGGPGSKRRNSWSDGMYFGGFINGAASTYISGDDASGITIVTPMKINLQSTGNLNITSANCTLNDAGDLTVKGNVTAGAGSGGSVELQHHTHTNVQTGGGTSGPPTPGS